MLKKIILAIIILMIGVALPLSAQSIKGKITNQHSEPIPYANIFIKEIQSGTTSDENGEYFIALATRGEYELVISSLGYTTKSIEIVLEENELSLNIMLATSSVELDEIVVKASKKDPAYAIIKNAIDHKKEHLKSVSSFKSTVYVKATEIIDKKEKERREKEVEEEKKKKKKKALVEVETENPEEIDPFDAEKAAAQKEQDALLAKINLIEMKLTLNYQYPNKYKEERTAVKRSGSRSGLFIPLFGETDFNFYRNMVTLTGISEFPVISPLSNTAILSYKYKLIESKEENGLLVHKIKVIPRKQGNATCDGYIYINDSLWNINRLDLNFSKGGLKFFDEFNLKQDYEQIEDTLWIPTRQEFNYQTSQGKRKTYTGKTTIKYTDFENNYQFSPKFFKNEVVVTTKEAYDRDSTYWNTARPEPLTIDEQKVINIRDSIKAVKNSKEYKDSVQAEYNKVTILEILWDGVGWRDHMTKQQLYIGSLPSLIDFSVVGGFRLGPYASYFRRFENGKSVWTSGHVSWGLKNNDVTGNFRQRIRYNPFKLADITFGGGRDFQSINNFDAYLNQLRVSNYILSERFHIGHRVELFNGFYTNLDFRFNNRKSIGDIDSETFLTNLVGESQIIDFEDYQATILTTSISYTPFQKYMTEPNRKVILGSAFPTFRLLYRKGLKGTLGSDIDFDYVEFSVEQDLILNQFGNSKYKVIVGDFLNTNELKFVDLKRFRQSDPILYSDPLNSFQSLDTALSTTNLFFEVHHIHHFNGALINNIPLIKKTKIRLVVGGGVMYLKDNNFRHEEVFGGVERVFKIGARRRLRVGLYGVVANGNQFDPAMGYKISLDIIDTWKRDWSF